MKTFSSSALCLRPDSTQFGAPTAKQPCSPTCFRRLAWRWRRDYRWPLDSNYTSSWKSSFLPLEYSAGKFKVNHLSGQGYLAPLFLPTQITSLSTLSHPFLQSALLSLWSHSSLCFFPGGEVRETWRFQCVIFLYAWGPACTAAPLLCTCWQRSSAKALGAKA